MALATSGRSSRRIYVSSTNSASSTYTRLGMTASNTSKARSPIRAIERALAGVDTFINMVMKSPQDGSTTEQNPTLIAENYAVNTVGLHLLLHTAHGSGFAVVSTLRSASVHNRDRDYFPSEEQVPLDGESVYGLTKGFAEQVCAYFSRWFDMNLIALRLSGPEHASAVHRVSA